MYSQLSAVREMFSDVYVPFIVLVGLFVALLFRRDAIVMPALFRIGYFFVVASILLPALLAPITMDAEISRRMGSSGQFTSVSDNLRLGLLNAITPILMAIGLLCVFGSLLPTPLKRPTVMPPQKHPLD